MDWCVAGEHWERGVRETVEREQGEGCSEEMARRRCT